MKKLMLVLVVLLAIGACAVPADAEIPSHRLMIRAGIMRKLASGTYTYLPLGFRVLQKVTGIVREEMNKSGAQEILMPSVQLLPGRSLAE